MSRSKDQTDRVSRRPWISRLCGKIAVGVVQWCAILVALALLVMWLGGVFRPVRAFIHRRPAAQFYVTEGPSGPLVSMSPSDRDVANPSYWVSRKSSGFPAAWSTTEKHVLDPGVDTSQTPAKTRPAVAAFIAANAN